MTITGAHLDLMSSLWWWAWTGGQGWWRRWKVWGLSGDLGVGRLRQQQQLNAFYSHLDSLCSEAKCFMIIYYFKYCVIRYPFSAAILE